MRNLNIARRQAPTAAAQSAAAWDRQVARQHRIIAEAQGRMAAPWCTPRMRQIAECEIAVAQKRLADLMTDNPYEA